MQKYMTDTLRYSYVNGVIQLPDKSIVLGVRRTFQDDDNPYVMNFGSLYKFSSNMDSLWRKLIVPPQHFALGYEENYVTSIIQESNGDFVCGGRYQSFDEAYPLPYPYNSPWVARIDSTGCGEQACAVVATEASSSAYEWEKRVKIFPNPTTGDLQLVHQNGIPLKSYSISDISGRIIKENAVDTIHELYLHLDLSNGMYFLFVNDAEGMVSKHKVMIIR